MLSLLAAEFKIVHIQPSANDIRCNHTLLDHLYDFIFPCYTASYLMLQSSVPVQSLVIGFNHNVFATLVICLDHVV